MAIVPKRQKITVIRAGGEDYWGVPLPETTIDMKARVDEVTEVVKDQHGREVVVGMQIWLSGLADIKYDDKIEYIDELERKTIRQPVKIEPVRGINGKTIETVVYL